MRAVLVTVLICALAGVTSADIPTPGEYTYLDSINVVGDPPDTDVVWVWTTVELESIQDGVDLAESFFTHPLADLIPGLEDQGIDTGHTDTVLARVGTHNTVHFFETPFGRRSAICQMADGVTLTGANRKDSRIDHTGAQFGILCQNVTSDSTVITNLTIQGGIGRDRGRTDDGDGRNLVAGIACLVSADPLIDEVTIQEGATGIVVRGTSTPVITSTIVARGSHHGIYVQTDGAGLLVIDHVTLVQNFDIGVSIFAGDVSITNSSITHNGKNGIWVNEDIPVVEYCNLFFNDRMDPDPLEGPQNYFGMDDLTGQFGNFSDEPYYCDFVGAVGYDYHVCTASPNVGADSVGGDVGAQGGACSECTSLVEVTTWGAIKALYR